MKAIALLMTLIWLWGCTDSTEDSSYTKHTLENEVECGHILKGDAKPAKSCYVDYGYTEAWPSTSLNISGDETCAQTIKSEFVTFSLKAQNPSSQAGFLYDPLDTKYDTSFFSRVLAGHDITPSLKIEFLPSGTETCRTNINKNVDKIYAIKEIDPKIKVSVDAKNLRLYFMAATKIKPSPDHYNRSCPIGGYLSSEPHQNCGIKLIAPHQQPYREVLKKYGLTNSPEVHGQWQEATKAKNICNITSIKWSGLQNASLTHYKILYNAPEDQDICMCGGESIEEGVCALNSSIFSNQDLFYYVLPPASLSAPYPSEKAQELLPELKDSSAQIYWLDSRYPYKLFYKSIWSSPTLSKKYYYDNPLSRFRDENRIKKVQILDSNCKIITTRHYLVAGTYTESTLVADSLAIKTTLDTITLDYDAADLSDYPENKIDRYTDQRTATAAKKVRLKFTADQKSIKTYTCTSSTDQTTKKATGIKLPLKML